MGLVESKMGHPARKLRFRRLFEVLTAAKGTGMLLHYMENLAKVKVLFLREFPMTPVTHDEIGYLEDVIEERSRCGSLIVTIKYELETCHKRMPDPTIADAICDCVIHHAVKLQLRGESMRILHEPSHENDRPESVQINFLFLSNQCSLTKCHRSRS